MHNNYPLQNMDLLTSEVDDELILYNSTFEVLHVLNPTAKLVWELCDAQHSPEEMAMIMRERFLIQPERDVLADVMNTLAVFTEKGLLQNTE
jgi:hypothetical protein